MNIDVISDLHLDFYDDWERICNNLSQQSKILIVAGDLAEFKNREWLGGLTLLSSRWDHVVYVSGNHELYNTSTDDWESYRDKSLEIKNLHWLENQTVEIEGVRFHGATAWFKDKPDNFLYYHGMQDFKVINKLIPWANEKNKLAERWFQQQSQSKDVIVTHHMPHNQCVAKRWQGNSINRFFVSDFDLSKISAKAWIFGHTHETNDFIAHNGTRMISNPFGYPREKNGYKGVITIHV
jgi:predicted MPP superfamily phosphohydrolase